MIPAKFRIQQESLKVAVLGWDFAARHNRYPLWRVQFTAWTVEDIGACDLVKILSPVTQKFLFAHVHVPLPVAPGIAVAALFVF